MTMARKCTLKMVARVIAGFSGTEPLLRIFAEMEEMNRRKCGHSNESVFSVIDIRLLGASS